LPVEDAFNGSDNSDKVSRGFLGHILYYPRSGHNFLPDEGSLLEMSKFSLYFQETFGMCNMSNTKWSICGEKFLIFLQLVGK
jgi:hypothetical protein